MRDFVQQMQAALLHNMYFLAFSGALMIPDMAGAIDADSGRASKRRYEQWFDTYVVPRYGDMLTSADCYLVRCSMLHQGSGQHPTSRYKRILFVEPAASEGTVLHRNVLNDALNIDLRIFCFEMATGVEA